MPHLVVTEETDYEKARDQVPFMLKYVTFKDTFYHHLFKNIYKKKINPFFGPQKQNLDMTKLPLEGARCL